MRFLLKWLRVERPPGVALHPRRTVDLDITALQAFDRARQGIEFTLGGIVRESSREGGIIEATFGLVNSERMTVHVEATETAKSRVVIETRRGVSGQPAPRSDYVDALARYLQTG